MAKRSRSEEILRAAKKDQNRRRRELILILFLVLFAAGLFYTAIHIAQLAERSTLIQPFIIYLIYFGFWSFLLVLILVLVFLIVRNVVKYMFERRRGVLGAKIRVRLIVAFMALTLGPAAVLFLLATFILNTSIEQLYEPHVRNVVKTSKQVIESAAQMSETTTKLIEAKYDADGEEALHFARELSRSILEHGWVSVLAGEAGSAPDKKKESGVSESTGSDVSPKAMAGGTASVETGDTVTAEDGDTATGPAIPGPLEQLKNFVQYKRQEYGLAMVSVYNIDGKEIVRSSHEKLTLPPAPEADIAKAISGAEGYIPPVEVKGGAVLYAFYPVPRRGVTEGETEIAGAMVVGRYISWIPGGQWDELSVAQEAQAVIEDYETLNRLESPIKYSYFLLLVFVTLIVIFLAVWFGFRMSKGITEPIQLLAEGTEMVASGNLDYQIEMPLPADDEIATLVRSFNKMTADLAKSRSELDQAYRSLRHTNQELEQRRRYMETVLENVTAGVISLDPENRVSTVNPAAVRMLGTDEKELMDRDVSSVFRADEFEVYRSLVKEMESTGKDIVQRQFTIIRDKRTYVYLLTLSRLPWEGSDRDGTVIVFDDMSELIKAHRAMAWREVARRIAHEIKNPLTPIQLSAQRLERRYGDKLEGEERQVFHEGVSTIIKQVEELKHLVNEFSLFARMPSTQPEPSDLHELVREVLMLYRDAHPSINFEFRPDEMLPELELDREQMKRVFINLLDNASASMKGGGEISIETMYNRKLNLARIEIKDNGDGIPDRMKDRLFEPYYSTRPGGTGLGLTIVQRIISDHYGYIRITDNQPRGTRIIIEIPVVLAERRVAPDPKARTM